MFDSILPLPGLSPVCGKRLDVRFDGGLLSSDGGILLLREVEQRLGVADRLAACIKDPRAPEHITHSLADIIGFRLMMIAAGYEDGNDASSLRVDPMFKMSLDLAPSDRALCSQPTISRLENLPDKVAAAREAIEAGGARLLFLSPYSSDFNPIETAFSKLNSILRMPLHGQSPSSGMPSVMGSQASQLTNAPTIYCRRIRSRVIEICSRGLPGSPRRMRPALPPSPPI
jgi:hypothetical protein